MIKQLIYIFSRKDKIKILVLFIMALLGSLLECVGVSIFMPFVNLLMDMSVIHDNEYLSLLYDSFHFKSEEGFLTAMAGCIIVIFVVKNVYMILQKYAIYRFSYNTQMKISTRLLRAYMSEPYTFHLNKNISVLQRSMQEDSELFTRAIIHFMELVVEIMVCMALGSYLLYVSKSITVIIVSLLVICVGIFTIVAKKYAKGYGKKCQGYKAKIYQWMNQALGGIKEIKILNRESFFISSYEGYFKMFARGQRINRLLGVMPKYVVEMVSISGMLFAIMIKMYYGRKDIVDFIPQLAAFAVASFRLLPAVGRINEHVTDMMYAAPSIELVYNDLKAIEDVKKPETSDKRNWSFEKEVVIKNICYRYPNTEENVIEYANFSIKKGETIALIGESGAGKTTMADIILGLLEPQYGKIKADEMDIFKDIDAWHQEIGYIPQMIYLSDDTIRNNVAFGIKEDEINDESVIEALRKAQLLDFIEGLADGVETMVGDRGIRLSGGQRQRIGIARALYCDPQILVLDEATSALDNDTETAVMEAIENLRGEKTIIIIAHRLTTIQNADKIYAVGDKKVVPKSKEEVFS